MPTITAPAVRMSGPDEFLSKEECRALYAQIVKLTSGGGETMVVVQSTQIGSAKWARNRVHMAVGAHHVFLEIVRTIRGARGIAQTFRTDEVGLREAIGSAETMLKLSDEDPEQIADPFIEEPILHPTLWSDATHAFDADARVSLVNELIAPAEAAGVLSSGDLNINTVGNAVMGSDGLFRYYPYTTVECSMTVRDQKGTASGWAGVNHYALERIEPKTLAARALDKCERSTKPQALEPGRYTAILEPQAVSDLFSTIIDTSMWRPRAELPAGPFGGRVRGRTKINEQVLDRRLIFRSDPMDPDGAFLPYDWDGIPFRPVNWIDQGILRELAYRKDYALGRLNLDKALLPPSSYRLASLPGVPTSTVDEMIAKTERGIVVTRFHGVRIIDGDSMLCSGYTRDGLWLVEHGKITHAVKNFLFTESPMFVLNKVLDIGVPQRVFAPDTARVVPAIRVDDFNFTSLSDAV